ncbi:SIS domain-containing protein [Tabrizicola sp. M-4]|uniref:SIS domain-containing protein n=1 Tax=Tabrizicola sp. M-4 TaxID=3055847 RepID=UPI003DA9F0D3
MSGSCPGEVVLNASLADTYLADLVARLTDLRNTAAEPLDRAAEAMAACIRRDGLIYIFGSGHSHMLAEEAHFRAGGLAATVPMLAAATMLHEGAAVGTKLERLPGLAPTLLARYPVGANDVMIVVSTSGVNAAPVEAAMFGKERGATVIAITSESYSLAAANGRTRIADLADIVLDNAAPPGDATQEAGAEGMRVGPVSTVIGAALLNAALAETARRLIEAGDRAPVYLSANMPGAAARNEDLIRRYRPRNPHL